MSLSFSRVRRGMSLDGVCEDMGGYADVACVQCEVEYSGLRPADTRWRKRGMIPGRRRKHGLYTPYGSIGFPSQTIWYEPGACLTRDPFPQRRNCYPLPISFIFFSLQCHTFQTELTRLRFQKHSVQHSRPDTCGRKLHKRKFDQRIFIRLNDERQDSLLWR